MNGFDDIPKYRKKSQARPPKKSKHKHLSEPCIISLRQTGGRNSMSGLVR